MCILRVTFLYGDIPCEQFIECNQNFTEQTDSNILKGEMSIAIQEYLSSHLGKKEHNLRAHHISIEKNVNGQGYVPLYSCDSLEE